MGPIVSLTNYKSAISKKPLRNSSGQIINIKYCEKIPCQLRPENDPPLLTSVAKAMEVKKLRRTGPEF